jgi:hypothetical protein
MAHITKHHSEEEGESDACEDGRVNFLVHGDTIGVNNFLETIGEII